MISIFFNRPLLSIFIGQVCILGLLSSALYAQKSITISGEITNSLVIQAEELKALPHTSLRAKDKDGKKHKY